MKLRLILAALTLVLIAAACGPEPQIRNDNLLKDSSFLTSDPCGPPCWRGIVPGETTWNDAIAIIEDDETLDQFQSREDEESDRIGAAWAQADGDGCCQMFTQDGETVSFLVMQTAPDSQLSAVIEEHGEPQYLFGEAITSDQGLISLFYVDVPMVIYVFIAGEEGSIIPESEVVGFAYTTPDLMQFLIDTSDLHEWEGYEDFAYYNDGEFEITPAITLTPSDND